MSVEQEPARVPSGSRSPVPAGAVPAFMLGIAIHLFAVAVYLAGAWLRLEGCDEHDGLALALVLAATVDVIASSGALALLLRRRRGTRSALVLGWGASFTLACGLLGLVANHIATLTSGCPV
ncbi:hypothetical protein [Catellatospora chokoriensis]|uniref:Uncharacterized protein n=1 Tax=Catellatospora chokoriensis TaxID=310353 RepID=A0A8J3KAH9_9ACTN|nr:hypothetical protein [Catellatospora chokoriensis]GIF93675.1 hypothetical protein Cch02nite_71190 [Catellatospora chokoriensis]